MSITRDDIEWPTIAPQDRIYKTKQSSSNVLSSATSKLAGTPGYTAVTGEDGFVSNDLEVIQYFIDEANAGHTSILSVREVHEAYFEARRRTVAGLPKNSIHSTDTMESGVLLEALNRKISSNREYVDNIEYIKQKAAKEAKADAQHQELIDAINRSALAANALEYAQQNPIKTVAGYSILKQFLK